VLTTALWSGSAHADQDDWFGRDKLLHFSVSAGLAAGGYGIATTFVDARGHALAIGGGFAFGLGIAKELYDATGAGDPSWKDLTWDAIGTIAGLALGWTIDLLVRGTERQPLLGTQSQGLTVRLPL